MSKLRRTLYFPFIFPFPISARPGELRRPRAVCLTPAHAQLRLVPAGILLLNGFPLGASARDVHLVPLALRALPLHAGRLEAGQELLCEGGALRHRLWCREVRLVGKIELGFEITYCDRRQDVAQEMEGS